MCDMCEKIEMIHYCIYYANSEKSKRTNFYEFEAFVEIKSYIP